MIPCFATARTATRTRAAGMASSWCWRSALRCASSCSRVSWFVPPAPPPRLFEFCLAQRPHVLGGCCCRQGKVCSAGAVLAVQRGQGAVLRRRRRPHQPPVRGALTKPLFRGLGARRPVWGVAAWRSCAAVLQRGTPVCVMILATPLSRAEVARTALLARLEKLTATGFWAQNTTILRATQISPILAKQPGQRRAAHPPFLLARILELGCVCRVVGAELPGFVAQRSSGPRAGGRAGEQARAVPPPHERDRDGHVLQKTNKPPTRVAHEMVLYAS